MQNCWLSCNLMNGTAVHWFTFWCFYFPVVSNRKTVSPPIQAFTALILISHVTCLFSSQMLVLGKHCMIDRKQRMTEAILSILIWNRGLNDVSETVSGMSNISCLEINQQGAFHQLFKRQTEFFVIWYVAYKKNRIFAMNNGHWISVFALSTDSPGLKISSYKNSSTGQENLSDGIK